MLKDECCIDTVNNKGDRSSISWLVRKSKNVFFCYSHVFLVFLFVIVCIYYTRVCVHAELNFVSV